MRNLVREAERNGYEPGEHVLAAVSGLRTAMLAEWDRRGWLAQPQMASYTVSDDITFGVAARAAGFDLGEIGGPGGRIGVAWKGLPASPTDLVTSGVAAIHSVRFWQHWDEAQIRAFFRDRRLGAAAP